MEAAGKISAIHGHLGDFLLDYAKLSNTLAKLFTIHSLFGCQSDTSLHATDRATTQPGASIVENGHRDLESLAFFAKQVLRRDFSHS